MKDVNIKALTRIKENYERLWRENLAKEEDVKEEYDAVCAGITALEAEPCEDCVSRAEIDGYLAEVMSGYLYDEERERLERFSAWLWELPSVTPARKMGKWIPRGLVDIDRNRNYECSECHHCDTHADGVTVSYCWFCGAKMEVEE